MYYCFYFTTRSLSLLQHQRMRTLLKAVIALCLLCFSAHSQITVTQPVGLSAGIQGTYQPAPNMSPSSLSADNGTTIYRKVNYLGTAVIYQFIFRQNNRWKQGIYGTGDVPSNNEFINLETLFLSTAINPPCNAYWNDMTNTSVYQVFISGTTCTDELSPTSYFEALPQFVQLPTAVTTIINQQPAPKNGMMVYDLTAHCVKVYSNGQWKCLSFQ